MNPEEIKHRLEAAEKLLSDNSTSADKFISIRTLLTGINPDLDKKLVKISKYLSDFDKLQKGEFIELSVEKLPEETDKDKKKKKLLLLLIRSWKDLKSEVSRVKTELNSTSNNQIIKGAKITRFAKGPFGIITLAAIIIVGVSVLKSSQKPTIPTVQSPTRTTKISSTSKRNIKAIIFNNNTIPLTELRVGSGPECVTGGKEVGHYHANIDNSVRATDGNQITDPGGCGFGKVDDVEIIQL